MAPSTIETSDGRGTFKIRNFNPELPAEPTAKDRVRFVQAGIRAELPLDEDALHAAARALATIEQATAQVRSDALSVEHAGPATIQSIDGHVFLGELLPLFQPRGAEPFEADLLSIAGSVTADGTPLATTTMTFQNETHLTDHIRSVISRTRRLGRDYSANILTRRVTNPVLLEAVRIEFHDGAEGFTAMTVRDGVSRVISAWKVIYPEADSFDFPDLIAANVLGTNEVGDGNAAIARAKGRAEARHILRDKAARSMTADTPDNVAVRVSQAFTMPAKIVVGSPDAAEDFEETMRELVAVSNGESLPWSRDERDGDAIERALRRVVRDGKLDALVGDLALGVKSLEVQEAFWPHFGVNPQRRGVLVLAELMKSGNMRVLKETLMEVTGRGHISDAAYVRFLMPLIDQPWRDVKGRAAGPWTDGGPIPSGVDWDAWNPVVLITDFTELVPRALAGDADARITLQVIGGIALAADRLLVGKSLEDAPFVADVPTILDGLGASAAGLWLLAHAANAFDARRMAWNALPASKKSSLQAVDTYIVPKPSFQEPEWLLNANAGLAGHRAHPVPLTAHDVVAFSDPHRGGLEVDGPEAEAWRPSVGELRDKVIAKLGGALAALAELDEFLDSGDLRVPDLLGDEWERAHGIVSELQAVIWRAKQE